MRLAAGGVLMPIDQVPKNRGLSIIYQDHPTFAILCASGNRVPPKKVLAIFRPDTIDLVDAAAEGIAEAFLLDDEVLIPDALSQPASPLYLRSAPITSRERSGWREMERPSS